MARGLTLGGELGFLFLSAVSDLAVSPSSTSFWIGPLATYDFRPAYGIPLRLHANVGYYLDNSKNLVDFTGTTIFTREVASFAYGIADSRFRVAVGVDTPLEQLTAPVPMQIFAEYHLEIATDSADPAFAGYADHTNRDQQWVTFGVRARVFRGLTLDAGFDAAVRSVGYAYGPPLPPYNVIFGVSLPLDVDAIKRPVIVTQTVEKEPPPSTGTISGTVKSTADGKPISDAVVAFVGRARARVATDPDGSFTGGPLPPGPVGLRGLRGGLPEAAQGQHLDRGGHPLDRGGRRRAQAEGLDRQRAEARSATPPATGSAPRSVSPARPPTRRTPMWAGSTRRRCAARAVSGHGGGAGLSQRRTRRSTSAPGRTASST